MLLNPILRSKKKVLFQQFIPLQSLSNGKDVYKRQSLGSVLSSIGSKV